MHFNSSLKTAKGLGSSKSGTEHWWQQRVTALGLIPIILWFVVTVIRLNIASIFEIKAILASPITILMMILLIGVGLYHGWLGMKVIIEDYVHQEKCKLLILIMVKFVTIFTACAGILAVLSFYFYTFI